MRKIKELEARIDSITKSLTEMFLANSRVVRQFSCAIEDLRHDMDIVFTCNEEQGRKIKNLEADVVRLNKNITNVSDVDLQKSIAFNELSAKLKAVETRNKITSRAIEVLDNEIEDIEERLATTEDTVQDIVLEDYCKDADGDCGCCDNEHCGCNCGCKDCNQEEPIFKFECENGNKTLFTKLIDLLKEIYKEQ